MTPDDKRKFVADPAKGSKHNRGCAIDLSMYDLKTGKLVEMPSDYDEFSERASPDYTGGTVIAKTITVRSGQSELRLQGRINDVLNRNIAGRLEYNGNLHVAFLNYFFPRELFAGTAAVP